MSILSRGLSAAVPLPYLLMLSGSFSFLLLLLDNLLHRFDVRLHLGLHRLRGFGKRLDLLHLRRRRSGVWLRVVGLLRPRRHNGHVDWDDHVRTPEADDPHSPEKQEQRDVQANGHAQSAPCEPALVVRRLSFVQHGPVGLTSQRSQAPSFAPGTCTPLSRRPSRRRTPGARRHAPKPARRRRVRPSPSGRPQAGRA